MPLEMTEVLQLRDYLRGMMARAEHHAGGVDAIKLSSEFRKNALNIQDSKHAENFNDVANNRKDDFKCEP